jgi:hypothetical protein
MAVTSVVINDPTRSVSVSTEALPSTNTVAASAVSLSAYSPLTATNVEAAIQQLADQNFRGTSTPTGDNIQEGDTWYDTDDNQFYVYRETSTDTFEWVPVVLGAAGGDSDTLDAGAF